MHNKAPISVIVRTDDLIDLWLRPIGLAFAPLMFLWLRPIGLAFAPLITVSYAFFDSVAAVNENSPVLSPRLSMSETPSMCSRPSITFAIGVPSSALRWLLPLILPFARPSSINGQRRCV